MLGMRLLYVGLGAVEPTSFTIDAGVEHSFQNNRWTLSFKLKNLTDRIVYSDLNRPLPGRNFAFKVKYILK